MDDELKIMMVAAMKYLDKVQERSWEAVLATMLQNALLEPEGHIVARAEKLTKEGTNGFKSDGTAQADIVREVRITCLVVFHLLTWQQVQRWLWELINDDDVMASTKIDGEVLGKIVAQVGATIDNFQTHFRKDQYHQKTVLDIGVLRFPDIEQPFFKVRTEVLLMHCFNLN